MASHLALDQVFQVRVLAPQRMAFYFNSILRNEVVSLQADHETIRGAQGIRHGGFKETPGSFRANFVTALLNAGVELALVQTLDGHSPGGGETGGRYFKGYPVATLKAAMDRIDYGEEVMGELQPAPPLPVSITGRIATYLQS
jgi:hypothetical protein